jgi:septation ring formation regulator EzrA
MLMANIVDNSSEEICMSVIENVNLERIAKLETQVETIKEDVREVKDDIKELHSRITTGNREIIEKIDAMETRLDEKSTAAAKNAKDQHDSIKKDVLEEMKTMTKTLDNDINKVSSRVDILERWRWMIVGGAIVLGYVLGNTNILNYFK